MQGCKHRYRKSWDRLLRGMAKGHCGAGAPSVTDVLRATAAASSTEAYQRTLVPYSRRALLPPQPHRAWQVSYQCPTVGIAHPHITLPLPEPRAAQEVQDPPSQGMCSGLGHPPWLNTSRAFRSTSPLDFPPVTSASDFLLHHLPGTGTLSGYFPRGLFWDGLHRGWPTPSNIWGLASVLYFFRLASGSAVQELGSRGRINMPNSLTSQGFGPNSPEVFNSYGVH